MRCKQTVRKKIFGRKNPLERIVPTTPGFKGAFECGGEIGVEILHVKHQYNEYGTDTFYDCGCDVSVQFYCKRCGTYSSELPNNLDTVKKYCELGLLREES